MIADLRAADVNKAMSAIPIESDRKRMIDYGSVGARHFQQFADMANLPDDDLFVYGLEIAEATRSTPEDTLKSLKTLLSAHAQEWRSFLSAQGDKSFLQKWMDGGN